MPIWDYSFALSVRVIMIFFWNEILFVSPYNGLFPGIPDPYIYIYFSQYTFNTRELRTPPFDMYVFDLFWIFSRY